MFTKKIPLTIYYKSTPPPHPTIKKDDSFNNLDYNACLTDIIICAFFGTDGWMDDGQTDTDVQTSKKNLMVVLMLFDDKLCTAPDENYCNLLNAFKRWIKENKGMLSNSNTQLEHTS